MADWQAWLIFVALFAVPAVLLWLWRHEPSKPESRQDMEDAREHLLEKRPELDVQLSIERWRGMGGPLR
jgi:hypothetical protein